MNKLLSTAVVGVLVLTSCTGDETVDTTTANPPSSLALRADAPASEPSVPESPQSLTLDDIAQAISAVDDSRSSTATMIVTGSEEGIDFRTHETVVSDPSENIKHITVDYTERSEAWMTLIRQESVDAATEDAEESFIGAGAYVITSWSVPASYLVDGDTKWVPYAVLSQLVRGQYETMEALTGESFGPEFGPTDESLSEMWVGATRTLGAELAGFGPELKPSVAFQLLGSLDIEKNSMPEGIFISEQNVSDDRLYITLANPQGETLLLELDGNLDLVSVEEVVAEGQQSMRLEIEWSADSALLQLPPEGSQMSEEAYGQAIVAELGLSDEVTIATFGDESNENGFIDLGSG